MRRAEDARPPDFLPLMIARGGLSAFADRELIPGRAEFPDDVEPASSLVRRASR